MSREDDARARWSSVGTAELEQEMEGAFGPVGTYDVVGWPGAALQAPLRPGDLLLRVIPTDPPGLMVARMAGFGLRSAEALPPGAEAEGGAEDGGYAEALERRADGWEDVPVLRQVVGPDGLLRPGQIVLRPAAGRTGAQDGPGSRPSDQVSQVPPRLSVSGALEGLAQDGEDDTGPFRLAAFPLAAQEAFRKGGAGWLEAVRAAIAGGVTAPSALADLAFFARHQERMSAGVGTLIETREAEFHKLRAEWDLYRTIAGRMLKPSTRPSVFLPERASRDYDGFVAAPTTGRATLMVNGRNADGAGHLRDELATFGRMEAAVEALGPGDSLLIANWQFNPTKLFLSADPTGSKTRTWGDLLADKAGQGVKVRVIVAKHPLGSPFESDLDALDGLIARVDAARRDNFKYIVSKHPHFMGVHHQKLMVARRAGGSTVAFLGGLDISFNRATQGWSPQFVWHDIGAELEGLIAHDLEREFVARWNREKGGSAAFREPVAGWKAFEDLAQVGVGEAERALAVNGQRLQLLRTVSVGDEPAGIRRDDIWRGYFRLIGRATRFIYLENQYFHEPRLAEAIVRQAEAQPDLVVLVMVGTGTDDRQAVDPKATGLERLKQAAQVEATQNEFALRLAFFKRLLVAPLIPDRVRVYTLNYPGGILHSKLILVDDEALSIGSANANPRGFFFDTEINVMLDDAEAVRSFRQRLWAHNLGLAPGQVEAWTVSQFFARWDAVAGSNQRVQATPERLVGEGVIPFRPLDPADPRFRAGRRGTTPESWF